MSYHIYEILEASKLSTVHIIRDDILMKSSNIIININDICKLINTSSEQFN
jgi:hypothetical protein